MFASFQRKKILNISSYYHSSQDASKKGSIDEEVISILNILNSHKDYLSTSSCSGRIVLWMNRIINEQDNSSSHEGCGNVEGKWLFVTHQIEKDLYHLLKTHVEKGFNILSYEANIDSNMATQIGLVYLKVEPLILHIESGSAKSGQKLIQVALKSGYRNSGMTLTEKRCIVAVRSTLKLDVPVARVLKMQNNIFMHWIIPDDYLEMLANIANEKMNINMQQRYRLYQEIFDVFRD